MPLIGDLAVTTLILTVAIAARYVAIAWLVHALVWGRKDGRVRGRRLNRDRPKPATIRHELKLSLLSSWIYALPAAVVIEAWKHGGTLVYLDWNRYGVAWLFVSGAIYLLVQDAYYYWLHRLMHVKVLFRHMHAGHHRSRQPTAYASFAFDWPEAALTAWLLPALTFVIPIHPAVIVVLLTVMTVLAVLNHSGAELLPRLDGRWLDRRPADLGQPPQPPPQPLRRQLRPLLHLLGPRCWAPTCPRRRFVTRRRTSRPPRLEAELSVEARPCLISPSSTSIRSGSSRCSASWIAAASTGRRSASRTTPSTRPIRTRRRR